MSIVNKKEQREQRQGASAVPPFLCQLFNWSLENGVIRSTFKSAYITPLLKKADIDPADPGFYRPISKVRRLQAARTHAA